MLTLLGAGAFAVAAGFKVEDFPTDAAEDPPCCCMLVFYSSIAISVRYLAVRPFSAFRVLLRVIIYLTSGSRVFVNSNVSPAASSDWAVFSALNTWLNCLRNWVDQVESKCRCSFVY